MDNQNQKSIEETAVETIERFVNIMRHDNDEFCRLMAREHPTSQQAFTKLCLVWLELVASDEYATDGRNQASKEVAQRLLRNECVEMDFNNTKPSKSLPTI